MSVSRHDGHWCSYPEGACSVVYLSKMLKSEFILTSQLHQWTAYNSWQQGNMHLTVNSRLMNGCKIMGSSSDTSVLTECSIVWQSQTLHMYTQRRIWYHPSCAVWKTWAEAVHFDPPTHIQVLTVSLLQNKVAWQQCMWLNYCTCDKYRCTDKQTDTENVKQSQNQLGPK